MIQITIKNTKYLALIDTGSSFSIVDERINSFQKIKIKPIHFTTITGKDTIYFEIHTPAPEEFESPHRHGLDGKFVTFQIESISS